MKVLIHFPTLQEPPDAVFWAVDGELQSATVPETEATVGVAYAYEALAAKVRTVGWEPFFDQLAERTQGVDGSWEVAEIVDTSVTPAQFLAQIRRMAQRAGTRRS